MENIFNMVDHWMREGKGRGGGGILPQQSILCRGWPVLVGSARGNWPPSSALDFTTALSYLVVE